MLLILISVFLSPHLGGCLLAPNSYYEPTGPNGVLRQTMTACEAFGPAQNLVVKIEPSLDLVISAEPFNYATSNRDYGATLSLGFLSDQPMSIPNADVTAIINGREVPLDFIENGAVSSRTSIGPILPEEISYRRSSIQGLHVR